MCRWHDPHLGFWSELREPSQGMLREKLKKWTFEADNTEVRAWGGAIRSVRLAVYVSGGLKSHSVCGHRLISKSGSNVSLAERNLSEDRVSTVRWNPKGLRRNVRL